MFFLFAPENQWLEDLFPIELTSPFSWVRSAVPFFFGRCKLLGGGALALAILPPQVYAAPRLPHVEAQDWTLVAPRCFP